ncbi:ChaN family lipoprotein [Hydrogenivirga sp.]
MALVLLLIPFIALSSDFVFFEKSSYERFIEKALSARIVYLGETHDRRDIHELQLRVIRDLYEREPKLIILMEAFQQPFQDALDEYVGCEIDEEEMLRRTEYLKRWRFNPELYALLWRFAKRHYLKLFALNVPSELLREVRRKGLANVRSRYIPPRLMPFRKEHRKFLLEAMGKHRDKVRGTFFEIQLAWDMGMAYRVAKLALAYPDHRLVVIVGSGHVWRGFGIPERVNFLIGKVPQLVSYVEEDALYFLFSKDFSRDSSSTNSRSEPN